MEMLPKENICLFHRRPHAKLTLKAIFFVFLSFVCLPLCLWIGAQGWEGRNPTIWWEETTAACSGSLGSEFSFLAMGGSREPRGLLLNKPRSSYLDLGLCRFWRLRSRAAETRFL